jgi:hypothetical protein
MSALIVDAAAGATVEVQVTPFTHMAAERAFAESMLEPAAIDGANSETSNLLGGIDILRTKPIDITDPGSIASATASEIAYAAITAAVASLAPSDSQRQPDIGQALNTLAMSFEDGTLDSVNAGDSDNVIALQEIIDSALETLGEVSVADVSGVLNGLQEDVNNAVDGIVDPDASDNAGDSDVDKAKAFIADFRTWGVTINGEITEPGGAFAEQVELAGEVFDLVDDEASILAIEAGAEAISQFAENQLGVLGDFESEDGGTFTSGTLSDVGDSYVISDAVYRSGSDDVELGMTVTISDDGVETDQIKLGVESIDANSLISRWEINAGLITIDLSEGYVVDYNATEDELDVVAPLIEGVAFEFDVAITSKVQNEDSVLVDAENPITFAGAISIVLVKNDSADTLLPSSFSINGGVTNQDEHGLEFELTASIPGAKDAVISDDEPSDDQEPVSAMIGLQFTAQFDDVPEASISLTAQGNTLEEGNVSLTIAYGVRSLEISATEGEAEGDQLVIEVTNLDGVSLAFEIDLLENDDSETTIDLVLDGKKVGEVEPFDDFTKVTYIDGTFEVF